MVGVVKKNTKIFTIPNKYKDTLDNLIDNSDEECQNWPESIDKRLYKAPKFEDSLKGLLEKEDISDRLLELVPKTEKS